MTAPDPSPAGGEFGLDVEKAREAVTDLRKVYGELEALRTQAHNLARPDRSAHDSVSAEAFEVLALKADGGPGSFAAAMDAGMVHVDQLIRQMEADIAEQEQVDAATAMRIARA